MPCDIEYLFSQSIDLVGSIINRKADADGATTTVDVGKKRPVSQCGAVVAAPHADSFA